MIGSFEEYIITISYAPVVAIVFMLIYLFINSKMDKELKQLFFWFLMAESIELIAYDWELITAQWEYPSFSRVMLSVVGYSVRPIMLYLILLLAMRVPFKSKKASLYFIPVIVNVLISCSAFVCGIAFSYTDENEFVRGPLGFSSQIVIFLYFFWILVVSFTSVSRRSRMEMVIVFASALLCAGAMIVEVVFELRSFGQTSLAMASIFYFMYFQSNEFNEKIEETSSLNRELQVVSRTDSLTGLLNKRGFLESLERDLNAKKGMSKVLIFFDLDNFKECNDIMGHLAGDELLKKVAERLKKVFRESDEIGRFGGDEFYIFMQDIPYEAVIPRVERLQEELRFPLDNSDVSVTASIGVIYHAGDKEISSEDFLRHADIALYDAKKQGKDRYVINIM